MQQIIIGEDRERNVRDIKKALEGTVKNVEFIEAPPCEKDILEYVRKYEPAVVIMGVSVDGLNGMEMAKEIRRFNERVQIILISRLEYFALLKEAIRLKISAYLSEPIQEKELRKAVEEALDYYERINAERYGLERQEIILKEALKYAEYSFIYTALFSTSLEEEYRDYKSLLNLGEYGYILNIEIENTEWGKAEDKKLYFHLKDIISAHNRCVVGPRIGNRIIVFVNFEGNAEKIEKRNTMDDVRMAAHIIVSMEEQFGYRVIIGIGGIKVLNNIHISYEEAIRCLRYRGNRNVVEIRDIEEEEISREAYVELEEHFLKSVRLGSADAVDTFTALMDAMRTLRLEKKRNKIYGLIIMADREARSDSKDEMEYISVERILEETKELNSNELEKWAYNRVEYVLNSTRSNRIFRKSEGVKNAIRYLEENYMDQINLEDISRYIGISPQHLSKTFKEETGMNYIDWLTKLRIENAKKLLTEEKSTVKEVCYMVGYNDPNYFSRIFKKIEGVSPTEYVSEVLPSNNN